VVERINREQYNGFRELFYSFIGIKRNNPITILSITILNSLNTYERIKELRDFRAVQRFILFRGNKNIERIKKDYKPSVIRGNGGVTW
jgi:hypothetical protein